MRTSDYKAYHESITVELLAGRNRVRHFIGGRHWGEDGRYKEVLLMNYLRKLLPSNVSVGTGFVKSRSEVTKQIDLIIYDSSIPTLFAEGDFVIVLPESVYGIVEVKTNLSVSRCRIAVKTTHHNGEIIGNSIFNGIFIYENIVNFSRINSQQSTILETLYNYHGRVNHISFGPNMLMKFWEHENPDDRDNLPCYSFYELEKLSFGFFISNLMEYIHVRSRGESISETLSDFLYPTRKESMRNRNLEVKLNVPFPIEFSR